MLWGLAIEPPAALGEGDGLDILGEGEVVGEGLAATTLDRLTKRTGAIERTAIAEKRRFCVNILYLCPVCNEKCKFYESSEENPL